MSSVAETVLKHETVQEVTVDRDCKAVELQIEEICW